MSRYEQLSDESLAEIHKLAEDNQCDMWRPEGCELPDWVEQIIDACVEVTSELQERRAKAAQGAEEAYDRDAEAVARAQHEEWKRWIVQGGYADHKYQAAKINHPIPGLNTCDVCGQVFPKHHPDMVPWDSLPEAKRGKYRARAAYLLGFAAGRGNQIALSREEWALLVEVVEEWLLQPFSWRNYDVVEVIHSKLAIGVKSV